MGSFQPSVLPADVFADHRSNSGDGVLQSEGRKQCLLHLRTLPRPYDVRLGDLRPHGLGSGEVGFTPQLHPAQLHRPLHPGSSAT
jgi:hypothetical protein